MNEFRQRLIEDFRDREYREAYAEDFLRTSLAAQIRVLREQRNLDQSQLAEALGTKQSGISRLENVNYSRWNIDTLIRIAFALGARLKVSFETFGTLVDEAQVFSREALKRDAFEDDPVFAKRAMPEEAPTAAEKLRVTMSKWLNDNGPNFQPLVDWLQGYGLFAQGYEEPYQHLLRALPLGTSRAEEARRLARRVASFLDQRPDVARLGSRPDDLLYNLFQLCAGLDQRELALPLKRIYERLKTGTSHMSAEAQDALLAALIRNQDEGSPLDEALWLPLLKGNGVGIPGNAFAGLLGLVRMKPGDPRAASIALSKFAEGLNSRSNRREEFRRGIELVLSPGAAAGTEQDILVAAQGSGLVLPEWALESFPRLILPVSDKQEYFVYHRLLEIFPKPMYEELTAWPTPVFLLVRMTEEGAAVLEESIIPILNDRFSDAWLESDRDFYGHLSHVLGTIRRALKFAEFVGDEHLNSQHVHELVQNAAKCKSEALEQALSATAG